jgi:ubiquinone/menaquinone biosynthesis C-methylase UbiE
VQNSIDEHSKEYGAPMDEEEMDRIDMSHAKYFMLLNKKRWLAPIPASPQKVLDLACGTGRSFLNLLSTHGVDPLCRNLDH